MPNKIDFATTTIPSEDFTNSVTFNTTGYANVTFRKTGNLVQFSYQGPSKTWSANSTIFTLPSGYRPATTANSYWFIGSFNDAKPCQVTINPNTGVALNAAASANALRLYVAGSYFTD